MRERKALNIIVAKSVIAEFSWTDGACEGKKFWEINKKGYLGYLPSRTWLIFECGWILPSSVVVIRAFFIFFKRIQFFTLISKIIFLKIIKKEEMGAT